MWVDILVTAVPKGQFTNSTHSASILKTWITIIMNLVTSLEQTLVAIMSKYTVLKHEEYKCIKSWTFVFLILLCPQMQLSLYLCFSVRNQQHDNVQTWWCKNSGQPFSMWFLNFGVQSGHCVNICHVTEAMDHQHILSIKHQTATLAALSLPLMQVLRCTFCKREEADKYKLCAAQLHKQVQWCLDFGGWVSGMTHSSEHL